MHTRRRWQEVAVVAVLLAAGCRSGSVNPPDDPTTTPTPTSDVRLHATLLQYRPDEGSNRIEVEFTNLGKAPVTVRWVQLRWVGVRAAPRSAKDTTYAPGQTIDLTTTYGVAVCHKSEHTEPPHALAMLADGRIVDVELDQHGTDMLRRFHASDCALQHLSDIVSVSIGRNFHSVRVGGADYLSGNLLLRRPGGDATTWPESVTVTELTGSVLLTFSPASHQLPSTLRPGVAGLSVPVLIGSTYRCDDHSRSQSTQTFLLSAYVRSGSQARQQRVILVPRGMVRAKAQSLMVRACLSARPAQ